MKGENILEKSEYVSDIVEKIAKASARRNEYLKHELIEPPKYPTPLLIIMNALYEDKQKTFTYEELSKRVREEMKFGYTEERFNRVLEACLAKGFLIKKPDGYQANPY